jgi:hypothetical protein
MTVTRAAATAAPVESSTTPDIAPVPNCACARAGDAHAIATIDTRSVRNTRIPTSLPRASSTRQLQAAIGTTSNHVRDNGGSNRYEMISGGSPNREPRTANEVMYVPRPACRL